MTSMEPHLQGIATLACAILPATVLDYGRSIANEVRCWSQYCSTAEKTTGTLDNASSHLESCHRYVTTVFDEPVMIAPSQDCRPELQAIHQSVAEFLLLLYVCAPPDVDLGIRLQSIQ